jgi:hypothetical protein
MPNCTDCIHKKDLNSIIPWRDPSHMFKDNRCFYNLSDKFDDVIKMNEGNLENYPDIPDLRHDLYHHKWVTVNFNCPLEV